MRPQAMHPQLTLLAAQRHIADLHRAGDNDRPVHNATATAATSFHAVPCTPPRRRRASLVLALASVAGSLKTHNTQHSRLEPHDNQVGSRRK